MVSSWLMPFAIHFGTGGRSRSSGKCFEKAGGLEFELTGRCRQRILLRVLIEIVEAGGDVLPTIGRGYYVVALLVKLLPADEVGAAGSFPAVL